MEMCTSRDSTLFRIFPLLTAVYANSYRFFMSRNISTLSIRFWPVPATALNSVNDSRFTSKSRELRTYNLLIPRVRRPQECEDIEGIQRFIYQGNIPDILLTDP